MAGTGLTVLATKWARLAPNGTNPGLFQIRFQYIWLDEPNVLKSDHEKVPDLSKPTIPVTGRTVYSDAAQVSARGAVDCRLESRSS